MNKIKPELIIWDYDGVLADSEKLWIKIWQNMLNENFDLGWDFETADKFLGGLAVKTKIKNLQQFGITIDDDFLRELKRRETYDIEHNLKATPGVEEILQQVKIPYCLATGGFLAKTEAKLKAMNFKKYFPDDHIFTAEQVEHGKPEPDLFLFSAKQMNALPQNTIVIEDSLPGLQAAQAAGMLPVAFVGSEMNCTPEYQQKVRELGVEHIFLTMKELSDFLKNIDK